MKKKKSDSTNENQSTEDQQNSEVSTESSPNRNSYVPALWEKIVAAVCAVSIISFVIYLAIRNEPIIDPNVVIFFRICLSLAIAIVGAVIPGFLQIDFTSPRGIIIRAGGALALFVLSYIYTPTVIKPLKLIESPPKEPEIIDTKPVSKIKPIGLKKPNPNQNDSNAKAKHNSFEEYLAETNKQFFDEFSSLIQESKEGNKKREWKPIVAAGGIGKSTLFKGLKKKYPELIHIVKLDNLKDEMDLRDIDDLIDIGGTKKGPNSTMLGFGTKEQSPSVQNSPELSELLEKFNIKLEKDTPAFIVIDSIDEIHPLSAESVLRKVNKALQSDENLPDFCYVYIVGRPEGFAGYYKDPNFKIKPEIYEISFPRYETIQDVKVLTKFLEDTNDITKKDINSLINLADNKPFVFESIHILSIAADLIRGEAQTILEKQRNNEEIHSKILNQILARNSLSHNRPNSNRSDYIKLLEEIASKYTDVDENGFFQVEWSDQVEIEIKNDNNKKVFLKYEVANTLSRSGVAYMNPVDLRNPRFRFLPSWLHEHLVSSRNKRVKSEYEKLKSEYEKKYGRIN